MNIIKKVEDNSGKFFCGKKEERMLLFLALISPKTGHPVHTIISGQSSVGKSTILKVMERYLPDEMIYKFTRISATALNRFKSNVKNWSWDGKILVIYELEGAEQSQAVLRIMMSEGESRALITEKKKDGQMDVTDFHIRGKPLVVTTSADPTIEGQFINRCLIIEIDLSRNEIRDVLKFVAESKHSGNNPIFDASIADEIRKIPRIDVMVPFYKQIANIHPIMFAKSIRDFESMMGLIKSCTILNYKDRVIEKINDKDYLLSTKEDYEYCRSFQNVIFRNTLYGGLTYAERKILDAVKKLSKIKQYTKDCGDENNLIIKGGTIEDVMEFVKLCSVTAAKYLNSLVDKGLLVQHKRYTTSGSGLGGMRLPFVYSLNEELIEGNFLPTYDDLMKVNVE